MIAAKQLMQRIVEGRLDPWEGYQQIVGIFQGHAHLQMPELRSFVRIEDVEPNGCVSVTPELRNTIFRRAEAFLAEHNEVPPAAQAAPNDDCAKHANYVQNARNRDSERNPRFRR